MGAVTDPNKIKKDDPANPDVCMVYYYHKLVTPKEQLENVCAECRRGDRGCVACKKELIESMIEYLRPIQEKFKEYVKKNMETMGISKIQTELGTMNIAKNPISVEILDEDLRELILQGVNAGKYKKIARDKKFVKKLTDIYNLMKSVEHVSRLKDYSFLHYEQLRHISLSSVRIFNNRVERLLFRETETGFEITLIELNEDHYGNKK